MSLLIAVEGIDGAGKTTVINKLESVLGETVRTTEPNDEEGYNPPWNTVNWFGEQVRENIKDAETHPVSVFLLFLADHAHHYSTVVKPALENGNIVLCDRYIDSRYAYQSVSMDEFVVGDTLAYLQRLQENELSLSSSNTLVSNAFAVAEKQIPSNVLDETPSLTKYFYGLAMIYENDDYASASLDFDELSTIETDFPGLNVEDNSPSWSKIPDRTILLDITADQSLSRMGEDGGDEVFEKKSFLSSVRSQYLRIAEEEPERFSIITVTDKTADEVKELASEIVTEFC